MTSYRLKHYRYIYVFGALLIVLFVYMVRITNSRPIIADNVDNITFSVESGFYDEEFDLSISATGGPIYYTLDGSVPTVDSIKYEGPIHIYDASVNENTYSMITDVSAGFYTDMLSKYHMTGIGYSTPEYNVDKCTIVRAAVYYGAGEYSDIKTASYFVGFDTKTGYSGMNVVSIVTDPENLFDYEKGIYVTGKTFDDMMSLLEDEEMPKWWWMESNYTLRGFDSERMASCQFFGVDGTLLLSQACGIRIHGGATRAYNQKSLNIYAREEYNGQDYFYYNFFGNDYSPSAVTLTQGGNDYSSKMKDYLMNTLLSDMDFATMDFQPYVLFLDGEYWGVYWLTEKYDKEYMHYHYSVDADNVIMVKNDEIEEGEESDKQLYYDMLDFCSNSDLSIQSNYEQVCSLIDIDSYIDYVASMVYISRKDDWPSSNYALWRSKKIGHGQYDDGKWRWILFDVNSGGLDEELVEYDSIEYLMDNSSMFRNLMTNDSFREKFLGRLVDISENVLSADIVAEEISNFRLLMDEPLMQNQRRFFDETYYSTYYEEQIDSVSHFFEKRQDYILLMIEKYR